jgi:hypothetical protein
MRDQPLVREHGEHGIGELLAPDHVPPQFAPLATKKRSGSSA